MVALKPSSADCLVALVVEGDDAVRDLASALLEEADLDVIACADAEAAVSVLEKPDVNVAMVFADADVKGDMDGVALARTVAQRWPDVRMVVTSRSARSRQGALPQRAVLMPKPWNALDVLIQAERATQDAR